METCVTMTWMKLCYNLLRATGNPVYADQIEKSCYNSLLASMMPDGSGFAKYIPLEGSRNLSEGQCDMKINCCTANGPRAFVMLPEFAVMKNDSGIVINLYCQSETKIPLDKKNITLKQSTNYPADDSIVIELSSPQEKKFSVALRIPEWSKKNKLFVNGESIDDVNAASYKVINRRWKTGDRIVLKLDFESKVQSIDHRYAIKRGPIVLARDSRTEDGFVDETSRINLKEGAIQIVEDKLKPENVWMSFSISLIVGSDWESRNKIKNIHFYDFATSGNAWNDSNRYKVWQTETLDVRKKFETIK
jgi:DUF1680 family protein